MTGKALTAVAALCLLGLGGAGAADDRVGFAEEFNSLDGWKMIDPFEKVSVKDGVAVFDTWVGSFMRAKPKDQPVTLGANADCEKTYDKEVDLDKFRYLVAKIDEKSMYTMLYLNDRQVQVTYTTGIIAYS